jgi:predicted nucleic acid-binding protein
MIRSIYIDTSVFGGYFDNEFEADTKLFFDKVFNEKITIIISDTVVKELIGAPADVKEFFKTIPKEIIREVPITDEIKAHANKYITANVVTKKCVADCRHIAAATINNADVLVSWNFKHILNLERKRGYNAINLIEGYKTIDIVSPKELINYEY